MIAQYLGDAIFVYFGFPQAQEHAAERAGEPLMLADELIE
jgi:hypothetical protein